MATDAGPAPARAVPPSGSLPRAGRVRRYLPLVVAAVVLVLVFVVVLPRIADYGEVWRELRSMEPGWLVALVVADVVNLATFAPNFMAALPGLSYRRSLEVSFAGTAIANVAPLGGAVSISMQYGMLKEWGFSTGASSRAMVVSGVWNNLVNLGMPIVGLGLLTLKGGRNTALEAAARIGALLLGALIVVLVMVLRSDDGARRVGRFAQFVIGPFRRLLRKKPITAAGDALARFRGESVVLLRRRWLALTLATIIGVFTVFVVLVVCVRAVGIHGSDITFTEAFAAWSTTRLLSAIPITPGGLGIIEVGLTGALTAFGADEAAAVAAVLLYRFLTYLPPILLGAVAAFTWRRHQRRVEHPSPA